MVLVSYSHLDKLWRTRFETQAKPLSQKGNIPIKFWSDAEIKVGDWEAQLNRAMDGSDLAVLLVSSNFLASDYITKVELPRLLEANKRRGLEIIWTQIDPCDVKRFPEITRFQAMKGGDFKPLIMLNEFQWKMALLNGCDLIDEFFKEREQPIINKKLAGKRLPRINKDLEILAKPCPRESAVFVLSGDGRWWRQPHIPKGKTKTTIYLGRDVTKSGTEFTVVVITFQDKFTSETYPNLPIYRTKSEEIKLYRA